MEITAPAIKVTQKKSSSTFKLYNLTWQNSKTSLSLELDMIRHGGQWNKSNGELAGNGLYFHYRRFQELAWPSKIWEKGPFKNHWAEKCLKVYLENQYIGAMGCAGCVIGSTKILDPITGLSPTIKELCDSGISPTVMTAFGPSKAGIPFVKGTDDLYEITTKSGKKFTATNEHLVLCSTGVFCRVADLHCEQSLLQVEPFHTVSTSDSGQSAHGAGGQSYCRTAPDSQSGYLSDFYLGGEQPHFGSNICRDFSPSPTYAQGRNISPAYELWDEQDSKSGRSHLYQQFGHPSSSYSYFPKKPQENPDQHRSDEGTALYAAHPHQLQWLSTLVTHLRRSYEELNPYFFHTQSRNASCVGLWAAPDVVTSIKFVGRENFYDLQVPDVHHYYAEGFLHHNSGKSDSFGGNVLTDWYAHCDCTTVLVSSTDLKSLELRIWGMIKKYHKSIKRAHPWIPGYLIEGKQMLTLDPRQEAEDGRDFKNGIIAVACKKGNQFVGLGPLIGIHNKRVRLLADECFVAGTMVDTSSGPMPIESIRSGDIVKNANGFARVISTSVRNSVELVIIKTRNGRKITCTQNHPFFTSMGWIKACNLHEGCLMLTTNEAMRILRGSNAKKEQAVLQSILLSEVDALPTGHSQQKEGQPIKGEAKVSGRASGILRGCVEVQSRKALDGILPKVTFSKNEIARLEADSARRKRNRSITIRVGSDEDVSKWALELCNQNWNEGGIGISSVLQSGLGISRNKTGHRSRRTITSQPNSQGYGSEKGGVPDGDWVASIEIQKCTDSGLPANNGSGHNVYNLHVEGHPSYSVEGLLVHNCNLMPRAFLDAASNLSKCEDFKLIGLGNPNETTNAHGFLCEPAIEMGGWEGAIDQSPGTKTWPTRFPRGICIQLPGSDSPNMAVDLATPPPFPFLITRQQMMDDAKIWGVDDWHYTMMNEARMPRGQGSRRVMTRQMCERFGAFLQPNWRDSNRKSVAFLDAAYRGVGGDRCIFGELQFGTEVEPQSSEPILANVISQSSDQARGKKIVALIDLIPIPIQSGVASDSPEDQIVKFVMEQCERRRINPEYFYYDAGMRTSLVTAFSRLWDSATNSIDCGGSPTERNVSSEIAIPCHKYYSKFVTELWFTVRYAVEAGQFRGITDEAATEFSQREWKMVSGNRIEVESKEEMKVKTGRSPDLADAIAIGVHGAIKRGFLVTRLSTLAPKIRVGPDWRDELKKKARAFIKSGQINHKTA